MKADDLLGYSAIMVVSLLLVSGSLLAVSLKEKNWINWQTFPIMQLIGIHYILPAIHMALAGPDGSLFAYFFCYTTYALSSVGLAASYCFLKPLRLRTHKISDPSNLNSLPWILLLLGILFYLPVLIKFHQYLTQPRQIYAEFSQAGYGLNFFISSSLVLLAFVTFFFRERSSLFSKIIFGLICVLLIYLHGSKGQLLLLIFISFLHRAYVQRHRVSFEVAAAIIVSIGIITTLIFAVFASNTDRLDLLVTMSGYADYDRNAMRVIDDTATHRYFGQLEFEEEFYSRIPRLLVPQKPRDYGQVRLARTYYPDWVRESSGTPAFGVGLQYADFGAYALLWIIAGSVVTGWLARILTVSLRNDASVAKFFLLLFLSGITLIPLGSGYLLPETLLLALFVRMFQRNSFRLLRYTRQPPQLPIP